MTTSKQAGLELELVAVIESVTQGSEDPIETDGDR